MIMRWLIRLAFPALGLLLLLILFGIHDPGPAATKPDSKTETADMPSFEGIVPTPTEQDGPEIVFKWQDTDGSWHYADRPPERGAWNALAIDPGPDSATPETNKKPDKDDWQAPYSAPFALDASPFQPSEPHFRNDT